MKNIHILPTDKPPIKGDLLLRHIWKGKPNECISWWRYNDTSTYGSVVVYTTLNGSFMDSPSSFKVQNLYITSDEEIKVGDYFIESLGLPDSYLVHKLSKEWKNKESFYRRCTKVILTTDQDLIKDGVQAIDDEFLEWFVKNPSCESVEVEIETTSIQLPQQQLSENSYDLAFRWINKKVYKIIIPKEEPKQETIEEAIKREYETRKFNSDFPFDPQSFKLGAKWAQERMYSEEEVTQLLIKFNQEIQEVEDVRGWFEQFKKK